MGPFARSSRLCVSLLFPLFGVLAGCAQPNKYAPPPPAEVTVAKPIQKDVTIYKEFPGQLRGFKEVEVRARVKGYLQEVRFTEGAEVKKGELLYTIEPDVYEAKRDQAGAELKAWQTERRTTRRIYEQMTAAYNSGAAGEQEWLKAQAAYFTAESREKAAQAALREAELNLKYAKIKAEINGVISESYVDVGNLVGSEQATLLATIIRRDPIYAEFSVSSNDIREYRKQLDEADKKNDPEKNKRPSTKNPTPVDLKLSGADSYLGDDGKVRHQGFIDFVDNQVDPLTATYKVRAQFPNPKTLPSGRTNNQQLLPGERVIVRVPISKLQGALLVPEDALNTDQVSEYLLVVNDKNKVERRKVTVGSRYQLARKDPKTNKLVEYDYLVIRKGIGPEDRVVVNGLQRARPGVEVKPISDEG